MNKYINKLTVNQYKFINTELKRVLYDEKDKYTNNTMALEEKMHYIQLSDTVRKIDKIIEEFSKK